MLGQDVSGTPAFPDEAGLLGCLDRRTPLSFLNGGDNVASESKLPRAHHPIQYIRSLTLDQPTPRSGFYAIYAKVRFLRLALTRHSSESADSEKGKQTLPDNNLDYQASQNRLTSTPWPDARTASFAARTQPSSWTFIPPAVPNRSTLNIKHPDRLYRICTSPTRARRAHCGS